MSNQSDSQAFVYANLLIGYTGTTVNGGNRAYASITNTSPILSRPSNYYGMIARLSIDNFSVPLIIPRVELNQPDINKLVYQFALGYNGIYSDAINVEFITTSSSPAPASPVGAQQDLNTSYYYIYQYNNFLEMWNNTLATALSNLAGKTTLPVGVEAPLFYYDYTSGLVLKAQTAFYAQDLSVSSAPANKLQIYIDGNTIALCNGLPFVYQPNLGVGNCKFSMILRDEQINKDPTGTYWLERQQSIAQLCYWSSIKAIQLQTTMPIAPEYTQSPLGSQGLGQLASQTISLLTDFIPDRSVDPSSNNIQLVYNKVDSLRLFDLVSDTPLYRIDVTLTFVDGYGRIFPVILVQGQNVNIKFEFVKKDVYSAILGKK